MKNYLKLMILLFVGSMFLTSCYKKFDEKTYAPAFTVSGFSSTADIQPASLIGYWGFNGDLKDGVTGISAISTNTTFTGGIKGQAMKGALNGYVLANPSPAVLGLKSFTITYWVNTPVNGSGIVGTVNLGNLSQFWGNIDMFVENGSTATAAKFRAHFVNNNGATEHWIAKDDIVGFFDTWNNLAFSYDAPSKTFKMYMNGSLISTDIDPGFGILNFTNSGKLVFGTVHFMTTPSQTSSHGAEPWANYLVGGLDEIRIYNKALTDDEVNALVKLEGKGK